MAKTEAQMEEDSGRLQNINQVVHERFNGSNKSFINALTEGIERTESDKVESTIKTVREVLSGKKGLSNLIAGRIEKALKLEHGTLVAKREKRSPAYILLRCTGPAAYQFSEELQHHHLVDEVAVVVGNADLFIRVFGTQRQIQEFLTKTLHEMSGGVHESTTYFSFDDCSWQKYRPKDNRRFREIRQEDLKKESELRAASLGQISETE